MDPSPLLTPENVDLVITKSQNFATLISGLKKLGDWSKVSWIKEKITPFVLKYLSQKDSIVTNDSPESPEKFIMDLQKQYSSPKMR